MTRRIIVGLDENLEKIFALVDDEDYDRCMGHIWRLNVNNLNNGSLDPGSKRYVVTTSSTNGLTVRLHRFIMGVTDPKIQVHHHDNDPLNNQKANLEVLTQKEHSQYHLGRPW